MEAIVGELVVRVYAFMLLNLASTLVLSLLTLGLVRHIDRRLEREYEETKYIP